MIYEEQEISLTVSIGVAAIRGNTDDINDIEDILKMADDALYKAKARGEIVLLALSHNYYFHIYFELHTV